MSNYKTDVRTLNVSRNTNDGNAKHDIGKITNIKVEAFRRETGRNGTTYRRTITYRVRDGIAEVRAVEPTFNNSSSTEQFIVHHIPPMLAETDRVVRESIPEVKSVRSLNDSLKNERSKHEVEHPHANTDKSEIEA